MSWQAGPGCSSWDDVLIGIFPTDGLCYPCMIIICLVENGRKSVIACRVDNGAAAMAAELSIVLLWLGEAAPPAAATRGEIEGEKRNQLFLCFIHNFLIETCQLMKKKPETLLDICTLDILFSQITTFIKDCVAIVFGLQTLRLIDFTKIYRLKNLKPKNRGSMNFYECCDLTKKCN